MAMRRPCWVISHLMRIVVPRFQLAIWPILLVGRVSDHTQRNSFQVRDIYCPRDTGQKPGYESQLSRISRTAMGQATVTYTQSFVVETGFIAIAVHMSRNGVISIPSSGL